MSSDVRTCVAQIGATTMVFDVHRHLPGLVLIVFAAFGLFLVPDFGISWDEAMSRHNGLVSLKHALATLDSRILAEDAYLRGITTPLQEYHDRDYGVAFDLPAGLLERSFGLSDSRIVFLSRHALTFLVSLTGLIAVYAICRRRHASIWAGLAAGLLMVTSPRQFAESFYNSKDIVLMAVVAVAMATHLRLLLRPTTVATICHAAMTAIALNVRVAALGIVLLTAATLIVGLVSVPARRKRYLAALLLYVAATSLLTVIMWPYLWDDPWRNFASAVSNMGSFRWPGSMLFRGEVVLATDLPWSYLPTWIAVTTPPHVLLFFALGLFPIIIAARRFAMGERGDAAALAQDAIVLLYFFGPVIGVMAFGSILYDGWRHLYFVYPAMICLACGGLAWTWRALSRAPRPRLAVALVVTFSMGSTIGWMVLAHPHQYVYFNLLASKPWVGHYETDYWGVTGSAALNIALGDTDSELVSFWTASAMNLPLSAQMLPSDTRPRVKFVDTKAKADYVITNYREHWARPYDVLDGLTLVRHIYAGSEIICSVYRRENDRPARASHSD
jgi:hypothetical protein